MATRVHALIQPVDTRPAGLLLSDPRVAAQRPTGCYSVSYAIRKARNGREDCASETVITPESPAQLSLLPQLSSPSVDPPISVSPPSVPGPSGRGVDGNRYRVGSDRRALLQPGADMISGSSRWRRQTADQSFNCSRFSGVA